MHQNRTLWVYLSLSWLAVTLASAYYQPFPLGDQLHYLGVAWEMWLQKHFLLPIASGHLDLQKPPLFYWIIHSCWKLFGVSNLSPRLITHGIAFVSMLLTARLVTRFYPNDDNVGLLCALILGCFYFWFDFAARVRFDGLLVLFIMLGLNAIVDLKRAHVRSIVLLSLAIAGGFMSKGPLVLLFLIPGLYFFRERVGLSFTAILVNFIFASCIGFLFCSLWLIPVIKSYGWTVIDGYLFKQASQRILHAGALMHWGKYIERLPGNILPWTAWPLLWVSLGKQIQQRQDSFQRFLLFIIFSTLFFFTFIVDRKVSRYIFPVYPFLAAYFAVALIKLKQSSVRFWYVVPTMLFSISFSMYIIFYMPFDELNIIAGLSLLSLNLIIFFYKPTTLVKQVLCISIISMSTYFINAISLQRIDNKMHSLAHISQAIAAHRSQGHSVVKLEETLDWQNYEFLGRLKKPVLPIRKSKLTAWLKQHPNGYLLTILSGKPTCVGSDIEYRINKHYFIALWPNKIASQCRF